MQKSCGFHVIQTLVLWLELQHILANHGGGNGEFVLHVKDSREWYQLQAEEHCDLRGRKAE